MRKIEYGDVLRRAWTITWNNKLFWWLGFFVAIGSGFNGYSYDSGKSDKAPDAISLFMQNHPTLFFVTVAAVIVIGIILYILSVISSAALTLAVNDPVVYSQSKISKLLATGKKFFWRLFAIDVVFGLALLGIAIVLIVPTALLFYLKSYILGSFAVVCALAIIVPVLVLGHFMRKYAAFYVVLSGMKFREAIEFSYTLFTGSIKESVLAALLSVGISILISISFLAIILFAGVVLFLIGLLLNLLIGNAGVIAIVCIGILLLLGSIAILSGAYQTFFFSYWVCFYKEIAANKDNKEEELAAEKEISLQQSGSPEAA